MSADDEKPGGPQDPQMEQDDIDSVFSGNNADGGSSMNLNEISEPDELIRKKTVDQEFAIGEPMANDVTAIYDIPVQISAVLGRSTMQVSQLLKLGRGAVVELDRKVGEAIDIYVNNRLVARGEGVVVEDKLGVTMTEIVKSDRA